MSESALAPFPWQMGHWQSLLQQYWGQRLAHALLLSGPAGTGKSAVALALARILLCAQPVADRACGHCKGCQLMTAGSHPDFLQIVPDEKGRAIKVDQVRAIKQFTTGTAQLNGYKVIVLNPADSLNIHAGNALLKELEEPPAKTLFLLVSSAPQQIVATIRSRCQQQVFPAPEPDSAEAWLSQYVDDAATRSLLLSLADNAPLRALAMHESEALALRKTLYRGLAEVQQGKASPVSIAQQWQGYEALVVIDWLQRWIFDLIKTVMTGACAEVSNRDLAGFLVKSASHVRLNELYLYLDDVQAQRQALLSGHNPNPNLLYEALLTGWQRCFQCA